MKNRLGHVFDQHRRAQETVNVYMTLIRMAQRAKYTPNWRAPRVRVPLGLEQHEAHPTDRRGTPLLFSLLPLVSHHLPSRWERKANCDGEGPARPRSQLSAEIPLYCRHLIGHCLLRPLMTPPTSEPCSSSAHLQTEGHSSTCSA